MELYNSTTLPECKVKQAGKRQHKEYIYPAVAERWEDKFEKQARQVIIGQRDQGQHKEANNGKGVQAEEIGYIERYFRIRNQGTHHVRQMKGGPHQKED